MATSMNKWQVCHEQWRQSTVDSTQMGSTQCMCIHFSDGGMVVIDIRAQSMPAGHLKVTCKAASTLTTAVTDSPPSASSSDFPLFSSSHAVRCAGGCVQACAEVQDRGCSDVRESV